MKKKTNDAKDPSKMSPQEIATELANNKKRRIELAKKLVRSDKEKAELQELGDRWRELYNYQKSTHIPGWYGTFPGASLDSAEKTWAITQDMMNGKFTSDAISDPSDALSALERRVGTTYKYRWLFENDLKVEGFSLESRGDYIIASAGGARFALLLSVGGAGGKNDKVKVVSVKRIQGPFTSDAEEPWVVFTLNGKELAAYTVRGTFSGELQATKESLAAEKGVDVSQIKHRIETRKTGKPAKDAEGSEVKNSTGAVKCKKCGSQLWSLRSGEYYCTKCGAKMDAPLSKDAKSESEWDLKFRLRHALPGETMSNKLGTVRGILAREGFDRNFKSYGDRVFSATHSRMGFTVNIETEPTDDSRKVLKIRQVWFSDSKPTTDADMSFKLSNGESGTAKIVASAPAGYTYTNRTFNGYKIYKNGSNYVAVALRFDKPTYEGLANKINGDSKMAGVNYRMSLDEAAKARMTKDDVHVMTFETMFVSLAEAIKNYCNINLGIKAEVSKHGYTYRFNIYGTQDELKKVKSFINGQTIHEKR